MLRIIYTKQLFMTIINRDINDNMNMINTSNIIYKKGIIPL